MHYFQKNCITHHTVACLKSEGEWIICQKIVKWINSKRSQNILITQQKLKLDNENGDDTVLW